MLQRKIGNIYIGVGVFFCVCAILLLAYPQLPLILNVLSLNSPEIERDSITQPIFAQEEGEEEIEIEIEEEEEEDLIILPPRKLELPNINRIYIPKIGVSADLQTDENPNVALDKGPWMVPDYGNPENRYLQETIRPILIASHRFGYSSWSQQKRNSISFFNLPNTGIGDTVIIIWGQREYMYTIFDMDESTFVRETDADLILYTCMYYNSPNRIFRYAYLTTINGNPANL
jgi:sortase (surface protein transpeptidase)